MKKAPTIIRELKSERGSVLLEFCLMIPIWLLMFGGTFMLFDISMAKFHLQEANRNLTWMQDDRYDSKGLINKALYDRIVLFYETRNALEKGLSKEAMWSYGESYQTYSSDKDGKKKGSPQFWGSAIGDFKENGVKLEVNSGAWEAFSNLTGGLLDGKLENDFMSLRTGNMELKMDRVSAVYLGAVGLSSVLFPAEEGDGIAPLYQTSLSFTRAREKTKKGETRKDVNGEMLLMRRKNVNSDRDQIKNVLDLFKDNSINRAWPSDGTWGDIELVFGLK